jgi:hypothetical protein
MKTPKKKSSSYDDKPPVIVNIADISPAIKTLKVPLLIHFTEKQFEAATAKLKRVKKIANAHTWLDVVPVPGTPNPGDVLVGLRCGLGSLAFPNIVKDGDGFKLILTCIPGETRDPNDQPDQPVGMRPPPCSLVIFNGEFGCIRTTCKGSCLPVYSHILGAGMRIVCSCKN